MPAILVTEATRHFLIVVAVAIASTHCAYSRRDGQVELAVYSLVAVWGSERWHIGYMIF